MSKMRVVQNENFVACETFSKLTQMLILLI